MKKPLYLFQEFGLLLLADDTGRSLNCAPNACLAAAMMSELVLLDRISIGNKKDAKVKVIDNRSTKNQLLDDMLEKISSSKKHLSIGNWLGKFAMNTKLFSQVADQLCAKQLVRREDVKMFFVTLEKRYPEIHHKTERLIRNRMAKLMFGQTTGHDARTTMLIGLANGCGLLAKNFDKARLERNKHRVKRVAEFEMFEARSRRSEAKRLKCSQQILNSLKQTMHGG